MANATIDRMLTPPQVAKMLGVAADKVRGFIERGQLVAANLACDLNGRRPRYRILPAEVEKFIASRTVAKPAPAPQPRRRRRRGPATGVKEFF